MALIVEANRTELPAIAELAREIWYDCYRGMISDEQIAYMLDWMYTISVMEGELTQNIHYILLKSGDELLGFASYGPASGDELMLHKLYVSSAYQRHGYGKLLLDYVEEQAVSIGSSALILRVNRNNRRAVPAYKKYGFSIRCEDRADIGGGFVMDDYIMAKPIGNQSQT